MFPDKNIYLLIINGILKDREVKFIPCLLVIFIDTYTSHIINPSALFPSVQICGNGLLIRNVFLEFMEYDGLLDYSVICRVFNQAGCLLSIMLPSLPVYPPPSVQEATLHLLSNKLSAYHHTDMGHFLLLSPMVSSISYQIFSDNLWFYIKKYFRIFLKYVHCNAPFSFSCLPLSLSRHCFPGI